ncbi:hypothetical protein R3W88_022998 [Solanum pinnatisectum]|uniref:Uncharacterized protein n=1 Tax=Solanum pinnatisectum TaxID=50273 RepID=A0AAV9LZK1_9SOLN|nr:hypothetical protein R3W88_022998 [Solanum pinnatisectum]
MMCSLEDGDVVEVFVRHLVDKAIVGPMLIENDNHVNMGESGSAFKTRPSESENFNFGVDVVGDDDIDVGPAGPDFSEEEVEGSNYSIEDSVESEAELVGDDDKEEYGSDVHEEVRELRTEKEKFSKEEKKGKSTS